MKYEDKILNYLETVIILNPDDRYNLEKILNRYKPSKDVIFKKISLHKESKCYIIEWYRPNTPSVIITQFWEKDSFGGFKFRQY